ncbi:hypothetical protein K2173_004908 [Erythroxylum novogranatense]|uniref:Meiosis-specific protein ASY3-like coiled-coil domain-containing protein n=1 Tax=Erythroxylum novogranatense TaxID=1862640 RepID=A0AAV8U8H9_9ROSI|nr:hypothetical protein K2173_004908 [Erythroxylum novogranatense]
MAVEIGRNSHADPTNDSRSFGSDYRPSSQLRKMSIGIMVDSSTVKRFEATKGDEVLLPNSQKEHSSKQKNIEVTNKGKAVIDDQEGRRTETPEKAGSRWITTKPYFPQNLTSENFSHAQGTSILSPTDGRWNKYCKVKEVAVAHSMQLFTNQTSILQSGDGKRKNFGGVTYKRKAGKGGNPHNSQGFSFATVHGVHVSGKGVSQDKNENGRTETLRMKLQEILGTISSPKSQPSNFHGCEGGVKDSKSEHVNDQKNGEKDKPRQNSDTIETDSESPHNKRKRPVTRSLSRKRASTKPQAEKKLVGLTSGCRRILQENIFSFQEGLLGKTDTNVSGSSSLSSRKKGHRKSSRITPKILFTEKSNADVIPGVTCRNDTFLPSHKVSSLSNKVGSSQDRPPESCHDHIEQNNKQNIQEFAEQNGNKDIHESPEQEKNHDTHESAVRDSHPSPGERTYQSPGENTNQSPWTSAAGQQEEYNSQAGHENGNQQNEFDNLFSNNNLNPQETFQSPTFKISLPVFSSSPSSAPKEDQAEQHIPRPELSERTFTLANIRSFSTLRTSKEDCSHPNAHSKVYGEAEGLSNSPQRKHSPGNGKDEGADDLSISSSEERSSDSSEGVAIMKGVRERDFFSSPSATPERSKCAFHPTKRLRHQEGRRLGKFSPTPPTPKGTDESDYTPEHSEQNQGDELERVVMLFALSIENFRKKLTLLTRKKSSEILMSVSEDIHLQLQNIDCQIQADLEKLRSDSKLKRKDLEVGFQEQQEQLKLIYDKFREEMSQHLENCKSTLEGLELNQIELKGTVKRLRASHQKLVVQVEESVGKQLNDAERRITAVHKVGRAKMLQLRRAIAECLHEDILN